MKQEIPPFLCGCCFAQTFKSVSIFQRHENIVLPNFPDNILFVYKIFLLVLPVVDERDNWIAAELVLLNMNITSCLFICSALICQGF